MPSQILDLSEDKKQAIFVYSIPVFNSPERVNFNFLKRMTQTKNQHDYFGQLDGIRAIAVGLVLIDHWLAERNTLPLGSLGVAMFFVLSGFLIIRILMLGKEKDDAIGRSHWFTVKQFIVRRTIRIFPIYYLALFLLFIFDVPNIRATIGWSLLYSTNFYIAIYHKWIGVIDHLWSLAVEEQFYLFFPYLILFLPKKYFTKLFAGMIALSLGLRLLLFFLHADWTAQYVLMPTCLDSFGLGGVMAYLFTYKRDTLFKQLDKNSYLFLSLALYIGYVVALKMDVHHGFTYVVLDRLFGSILSFFLILRAVSGFGGVMKFCLENPVTTYIGRISYGLYLYHNFVYNFYHTNFPTHPTVRILHKLQQFAPTITHRFAFELLVYATLTVLVATLSWFFVEKPVNNLKKYFNY